MTNAYNKNYLEKAQVVLGRMLDYAVYDLKYELNEFWSMFLASPLCQRFEQGDISIIVGKSRVELTLLVTGIDKDYPKPHFSFEKK